MRWILPWSGLLGVLVLGCGPNTLSSNPPPNPPPPTPDVSTINHPPELHKIGPKTVTVNTPLVIELEATDVDGDGLLFSVYGDVPPDSAFYKSAGRFEWTPTETTVIFLTFVVSDGYDTDRETVEVTVVTEQVNQKPVFQPIGDQVVEVGVAYELQLQASDPNGDPLVFATEEPLPAGALLEGTTGVMKWTPAAPQQGEIYPVVFTVTDGSDVTTLAVTFHVIAPGQNKPPVFQPVSEQVAYVGQAYSLTVQATDPDDDPLTYGLVEDVPSPDGLTLDATTHTIHWVPSDAHGGKTYSVTVWASDATYKTVWTVDIAVLTTTITPGDCINDLFEPNNTWQQASTVTVDQYLNLSICDTPQSPIDVDWYKISMIAGQTLSVTLTFEHAGGDLDVHILVPGSPPVSVAAAESTTDNEMLTFPIPADGLFFIRVVGVGSSIFTNPYHMTVSTSGTGCDDDLYENNDSFGSATALDGNITITDTQFCPADRDVYKVSVGCGEDLTATVAFDNTLGNLDCSLYRSSDLETPVAISSTEANTETVSYQAAVLAEDLYVVVDGNPSESTANGYSLAIQLSGAATCTDDLQEPNDSKLEAVILKPPSDQLGDLTLCCSSDWFYVPLKMGDSLAITVSFSGSGSVAAELRGPDALTVVAEGKPNADGLSITLANSPDFGNHYLVLEGPPGILYNLVMTVAPFDGCTTSKTCENNNICQKSTATCVDDECTEKTDCPFGQSMPCLDGHCTDGCTYDADCRLMYRCKGFDVGRYCGLPGTAGIGDGCGSYEDCGGNASCPYQDHGGYCTNIGCASNAECPSGSHCVPFGGHQLCGKICTSNSDCRTDEGYTCQPNELVSGIPTKVCLPSF